MGNISSVAGNGYYNSVSQIASGTKLGSAADGAAELAIAEKETAQVNGLNMGQRNAEDGKSLLKSQIVSHGSGNWQFRHQIQPSYPMRTAG